MVKRAGEVGAAALGAWPTGDARGAFSRGHAVKSFVAAILGGAIGLLAKADLAGAAESPSAFWAVVNADGTPRRGRGMTTRSRVAEGRYKVRFNQNVSQCAYSATLDTNSGFVFISLAPSDASPRNVFVRTLDRGGTVRDTGIHLVVSC